MRYTRLTLLSAALAAVVPCTLNAQKTFEGVVTFKVTDEKGQPRELVYQMKGTKMRMDMSGEGHNMVMLNDVDSHKSTMLMPEMQMYMEMDNSELTKQATEKIDEAKITKTGKTETIAGHSCEHILVESEGKKTDVCGAQDLGFFIFAANPMRGGRQPAWAQAMKGFFPLKVVTDDGKTTLEVTKIEPKSLDAALFTVPAGYHSMPAGMGPRRP